MTVIISTLRHARHVCMNTVDYLAHAQTVSFLRLRKRAWDEARFKRVTDLRIG